MITEFNFDEHFIHKNKRRKEWSGHGLSGLGSEVTGEVGGGEQSRGRKEGRSDKQRELQHHYLYFMTNISVFFCCCSSGFGTILSLLICRHNKLMLDCEGDAGDSQSAGQTSSSAALSDSGASGSSLSSSSGSFTKPSKETGGILAIMESIKRPPDQSFIEMTMSGRREKLGVAFDDIGMEGLTDEGVKWSSGASLSRDSGLSFMKSRASQANKPKWRVNSASKFTLTGSKLVRECNITAAALGINHSALLTGL